MKVSAELKATLDSVKRGNAVTILTTAQGKPWAQALSHHGKSCRSSRDKGKTFHDVRGTSITLVYRNGASIKHIAEVSGHSEKDAETIIRKHYLVSSAAVEKIESRTTSVKQSKICKPDK